MASLGRSFALALSGRAAALAGLSVAVGCARSDTGVHTSTRFSMGTVVEYTVQGLERVEARAAVDAAQMEVDRVAGLLWEGDSLSSIRQVNESEVDVQLSAEVGAFLQRSAEYSRSTGGAFDITVGAVLALYDFEEGGEPPSDSAIADRLDSVGAAALRLVRSSRAPDSGVVKLEHDAAGSIQLSVGGVAKGYAVDRAAAVLREHGVANAIVNAGGDLFCLGTNAGRPWRVGIRDPDDQAGIAAVLEVTDAAVATSGDYQQFFEYEGTRYHHVLDPRTGRTARGARSATVITSSAERADALATAVFVLGATDGIALIDRLDGVEGMVIDPGGRQFESAGFARYVADQGDEADAGTFQHDKDGP